MTPQLFIAINTIFFVLGLAGAITVMTMGARHTWLVGYSARQANLRAWMAVVLMIMITLCLAAAVFNLILV